MDTQRPCPTRNPLTDTPCVLLDDRLDHGSVGHVGVPSPSERDVWPVSSTDTARWDTADATTPTRRALREAQAHHRAATYATRRAAEHARREQKVTA